MSKLTPEEREALAAFIRRDSQFGDASFRREMERVADALEAAGARIADLESEVERLHAETRCPTCGCATPEDAERNECGCDAPVCAVSVSWTLAVAYVRVCAQRDRLEAALREAADRLRASWSFLDAIINSGCPGDYTKDREIMRSRFVEAEKYARAALASLDEEPKP